MRKFWQKYQYYNNIDLYTALLDTFEVRLSTMTFNTKNSKLLRVYPSWC